MTTPYQAFKSQQLEKEAGLFSAAARVGAGAVQRGGRAIMNLAQPAVNAIRSATPAARTVMPTTRTVAQTAAREAVHVPPPAQAAAAVTHAAAPVATPNGTAAINSIARAQRPAKPIAPRGGVPAPVPQARMATRQEMRPAATPVATPNGTAAINSIHRAEQTRMATPHDWASSGASHPAPVQSPHLPQAAQPNMQPGHQTPHLPAAPQTVASHPAPAPAPAAPPPQAAPLPASQPTQNVAHPATPDVPAPGPKPGMSTMDKVNAGVAALSVGSIVAPMVMGGHPQQGNFGT